MAGSHVAASRPERDIEITPADGVDLFVAAVVLQDDFDLRVVPFEKLYQVADKFPAEWCGQTDLDSLLVLVALRGAAQGLLETGVVTRTRSIQSRP